MESSIYCVVVTDAARGRVFVLEDHGSSAWLSPRLEEVADLVNPGRRAPDAERYSDSRPGARRAFRGGPGHLVDDRRDGNERERDRRFAAEVAEAARRVAEERGAATLVVAAPPATMGLLREVAPRGLAERWREVPKDLTRLSPTELHDYLARAELLPPRSRW